ncbi:MAG: CCA tRNA nucleotidyltransferase [Ruminococcus sp.]|nr:CCA tRNA nucleotidyltransferase [Ruminococcus sp.]
MKISIPENVNSLLIKLNNCGFEAFAVGGCVRDSLLGIEPNDWDITTSAKPSEIKSVFSDYQLIEVGEKHGTIAVVINYKPYEITTYRLDGAYSDNRRPDSVSFTDKLEEDLSRRDFTVNAMAYNDEVGLVDPFNGELDLQYKALRCVGAPDKRFNEDALRILRALRFASVYNLSIEGSTSNSIVRNRLLLNNISAERIQSEFSKMLCGDNINFILRRYKDVIAVFIPEIVATFECEQNTPHHNKNVWRHTTAAVSNIENSLTLRMTMFMHDIGKPLARRTDSSGRDHFKGHNHFSAVLAKNALERLKYPTKFIEDVVTLIEYHDVRFSDNKKKIKHVLNNIGLVNFERLLKVQKADILSQSKYKREIKLNNLDLAYDTYKSIIDNKECYSLKSLNINGSDLIHLGITEGKIIGDILERLLDGVIDGTFENDNVFLKKEAIELINELRTEN